MKDPLDAQTRPYEVLGIASNAAPVEVAKAYSRVMRNVAKRRVVAAARDRMTRTDCRLEDEFFYYPPEVVDILRELDIESSTLVNDLPSVYEPCLPLELPD